MTTYTTLPYHYLKNNTYYNRLLVEPVRIPEQVSESGLINPAHENPVCEVGIVSSVAEGSEFKPGDEVLYNKIDRISGEHMDTVSVDGKVYDVLYEHEVWAVNEKPHNRIFVRLTSEVEVSNDGLIIPEEVKSVTQKGIVHLAPEKYGMNTGDVVEYRKQEQGMYPEVILNGETYDVLFEADIFLVNDKVAPHRIVIKIDLAAQFIKRSTSDSGLALSPLFIAMLRNLQYAEIMDIGIEASKMYPDLHAGDIAIIHHSIEAQPYRILKYDFGTTGKPTYEYRIINCWEEKSREIFGKLHKQTTKKGRVEIKDIVPVNGNIFCAWQFELFEQMGSANILSRIEGNLSEFTNLDDLKNAIDAKKRTASEKAKAKMSGIRLTIQQVDPAINKDRYDALESEMKNIQREETRLANHLRRNHTVVCKVMYPRSDMHYVVATFEELYPINILGKKYLIAHPDFILAKTNKNMNIQVKDLEPMNDIVFVRPLVENTDGELLRPDTAKEIPQKGVVVASPENGTIKNGTVVLYRKHAGLEQEVDGVIHVVLKQNDLLARINATTDQAQ